MQKQLQHTDPIIMGILNITPDSFSNDGLFQQQEAAIQQAIQMQQDGASIIDIGGESRRPGADVEISFQEELDRVIPIIEQCHQVLSIPISIDTYKPEVMKEAINAGATMINDINALQSEGAMDIVAKANVSVCLMHKQGEPKSMQSNPHYNDVVEEVYAFLQNRIEAVLAAGIAKENIVIDPGFGFGKTVEHNLSLMKALHRFKALECPLLLGVSRKSTIGHLLDADVDQRLAGSLALTVMGIQAGASIIRTHDVKPTLDAMTITQAVQESKG